MSTSTIEPHLPFLNDLALSELVMQAELQKAAVLAKSGHILDAWTLVYDAEEEFAGDAAAHRIFREAHHL